MADYTTVNVKEDTWIELNKRKRPGDSFDDVIRRLLDLPGDQDTFELTLPERYTDAEYDAIEAVVDYVEQQGETTVSEIKATIHDDHAAGKNNTDYWWSKFVKPALDNHVDAVARPSEKRVVWNN